MISCPVCNKECVNVCGRTRHMTRSKDDAHCNFVQNQKQLLIDHIKKGGKLRRLLDNVEFIFGYDWALAACCSEQLNIANKKWSKEEDDIVREKYGHVPARQIAKEIGRSIGAVHDRANGYLHLQGRIEKERTPFYCEGCKRAFHAFSRDYPIRFCSRACYLKDHAWSNEEIETLKRMYPTFSRKDICTALPKRSWKNIICEAYALKVERTRHFWSQEEEEIIIKYYTDASMEDIMSLLPHRTWAATKIHALELGIKGRFVAVVGVQEKRVLNICDRILGEEAVRNQKYDWLRSPKGRRLEIDGYYPRNNLAIECQGEQHYHNKKVFYKTDEDFEYRCLLDKIKRETIIARGIRFLEIKYDEPITEEYLRKKVEDIYAREAATMY